MTTITIDSDCLANVDKLQSLLKLRFDNLSGQTITRGTTVNWAVQQQIIALATPFNSPAPAFNASCNTATQCYTASTPTMTSCGNPLMPFITYMSPSNFEMVQTTTSTKTSGDTNASCVGTH